jgi:threonine/homoserine/homoserine lactone efflux protein
MLDVLPLATYCFVMSITPGPNNVMVTASGVTFGYRRTIPHMLGISLGCGFQIVLVALGMGVVFERYPQLQDILRWAGAAYLVYLAWRLLRAGLVVGEGEGRTRPLTFLESAAFQFLNPKAWMIAVTTSTVFLPKDLNPLLGSLYMALVLAIVNYPSISVWTLFGTAMRRLLGSPRLRQAFAVGLALALVGTGAAMLWE